MLDDAEDSHLTRTRLVNSVVKALEKDSDWVYLYDAADELVVPEIQAENEYEETLQKVIQVCAIPFRRSGCHGDNKICCRHFAPHIPMSLTNLHGAKFEYRLMCRR